MNRPGRVRKYAGGICCVAGIVAIVISILLYYGSLVLFDADAFSGRTASSLAEPGVAALVSDRVTDDLISQSRDLTPYRPLILGTTRAIVASGPFRELVRRGARLAHNAVFSGQGREVLLTVSDVSVVLKNALARSPEIAGMIPDEVNSVLTRSGEISTREAALDLPRLAHRLSSLEELIFASGIVLLIAGILILRRRRLALLLVGQSLTVVAVVLLLLVIFGGSIIASLADDPLIAGAISGLWSAFLGDFSNWALVLGGIGIVLMAAATSLMGKGWLIAAHKVVWQWLIAPSGGQAMRALRGSALVGIGLLLVLYPRQMLLTATYMGGGLLFFVGLNEIFRFILGSLPAEVEREVASSGAKPRTGRRTILVIGAVVVLVAAGVLFLNRKSGTGSIQTTVNACNGYPELCDRRLNEVVFPATHNSMGAADIADWLFPNQERGIARQLEDGIRALLIDVHNGTMIGKNVRTELEDEEGSRKEYEEVLGKEGVDAAMRVRDRLIGGDEGDRKVYLCHGFCELGASPFVEVLRGIRQFLILNPGEVLILVIQDEGVTPKEVEACFTESGLIDFVYHGSVTPPWPTLREMASSGGRVVVMAEHESEGVSWLHQAYEVMQETPYRFLDPSEFSCEPNRGGTGGSVLLMNHWIETAPAPQPSNAEIVNAHDFLLARARQCEKERGMLPNIIAVDFYRTGDVIGVARTLNGVDDPAEE